MISDDNDLKTEYYEVINKSFRSSDDNLVGRINWHVLKSMKYKIRQYYFWL